MPQAFFMRVAMGLALNEVNREERAIQFYEILSSFDFMSSTHRHCLIQQHCVHSYQAATSQLFQMTWMESMKV
jgi:hypothetical protein